MPRRAHRLAIVHLATLLASTISLACAGCSKTKEPPPESVDPMSSSTSTANNPVIPPPELDAASVMDELKREHAADERLKTYELLALTDERRLVTELWRRIQRKDAAGSRLTRTENVITCIMQWDAEVTSKGFESYFGGPAGTRANEAGDALREVGLTQLAKIYDEALGAFPGRPSRDTKARKGQLSQTPEGAKKKWRQLEDTLVAMDDRTRKIDAAIAKYARAHEKDLDP